MRGQCQQYEYYPTLILFLAALCFIYTGLTFSPINQKTGLIWACEGGGDDGGGGNNDTDSDGINDISDNCPTVYNPDQINLDGDLYGDLCDNCPEIANDDQTDTNGNKIGDVCDDGPKQIIPYPRDFDRDGVYDSWDNCPYDSNYNQADADMKQKA
jgi:hypothetical protein